MRLIELCQYLKSKNYDIFLEWKRRRLRTEFPGQIKSDSIRACIESLSFRYVSVVHKLVKALENDGCLISQNFVLRRERAGIGADNKTLMHRPSEGIFRPD